MATISLKLLVDKEKNRVVFAESEKDFVDVLFSFLTLPIGTVVRVLGKQSSLGCMDKLYECVENLCTKHLETEACRTMLLHPRNAAECLCNDLVINVDDSRTRCLYSCQSFDCVAKTNRFYSSVCGARCPCGKAMDRYVQWNLARTVADAKGDVFLDGEAKYLISDDLHVLPASIESTLSLLHKLGIKDAETLEKRIVDVRRDEILALLKRSLLSKTPLTDVFMRKPTIFSRDKHEHKLVEEIDQIKLGDESEATDHQAKRVSVKLLENKLTDEVVYAEAGQDLVDIIFSFLAFPLGSIVKLLNKHSSITCIENLYESVEVMGVGSDRIKHEEAQKMLLAPMLYPHSNCGNQLLRIEEKHPRPCTIRGCETCWAANNLVSRIKCKHNLDVVELAEINPKLRNSGKEHGGGYARTTARFMVTNEMVVAPLSPISGIDVIKEQRSEAWRRARDPCTQQPTKPCEHSKIQASSTVKGHRVRRSVEAGPRHGTARHGTAREKRERGGDGDGARALKKWRGPIKGPDEAATMAVGRRRGEEGKGLRRNWVEERKMEEERDVVGVEAGGGGKGAGEERRKERERVVESSGSWGGVRVSLGVKMRVKREGKRGDSWGFQGGSPELRPWTAGDGRSWAELGSRAAKRWR